MVTRVDSTVFICINSQSSIVFNIAIVESAAVVLYRQAVFGMVMWFTDFAHHYSNISKPTLVQYVFTCIHYTVHLFHFTVTSCKYC